MDAIQIEQENPISNGSHVARKRRADLIKGIPINMLLKCVVGISLLALILYEILNSLFSDKLTAQSREGSNFKTDASKLLFKLALPLNSSDLDGN